MEATFGSGCFWCTEAIFQKVNGVKKVISGYSGGHVENPSYREVCEKTTGHAEVVRIEFDDEVVSYEELLEIFWNTHDPTTPDQQGNDVGPQYRSVVFYHNEEQHQKAEAYKKQLDESGIFARPIVTEISSLKNFYEAEDYHQDYFKLNGGQPYCAFVIRPKVEKFKKDYAEKISP
jgi:peptide-methionine (S)-S-oxide reductase